MGFGIEDLLEGIRLSRKHLLKHLKGVRDDQWDWKPNPECKSLRDTLAHLASDDQFFTLFLERGEPPAYEECVVEERDVERLLALLRQSHESLCELIATRLRDTPLDTVYPWFTGPTKLGLVLAQIPSEDYYHAGQVTYIRLATDPSWDYDRAIYGE